MPKKAVSTNQWNKSCNEKDFEQIFSHYYAPLCAYASHFLNEKERCESTVQNVFMTLWEKRRKLKIENLKAYLYRSVNHQCLHLLEKEKSAKRYIKLHQEKAPYPSPEEGLMMGEMYNAYQQELEKLPDQTKQIYLLSRHKQLKYQEIAKQLKISIKTVEAHISKALKSFKIRFTEQGFGNEK